MIRVKWNFIRRCHILLSPVAEAKSHLKVSVQLDSAVLVTGFYLRDANASIYFLFAIQLI